jgi:hypothetical protein
VIGLGFAAMIAQRSLSPGPVVVTAIGVVLLAGAQDWVVRDVLWPALLIVVGLLVLSSPARARPRTRPRRWRSSVGRRSAAPGVTLDVASERGDLATVARKLDPCALLGRGLVRIRRLAEPAPGRPRR